MNAQAKPNPLPPKSASDSEVIQTHLILPPDANALNTAFGGKVMEWIDICAGISAQRHCRQVAVTASMDDLHFHVPMRVGDIVILRARVLATFHTSMEVGVTATRENPMTGERTLATSALLTFVALDAEGKKAVVPPLKVESPMEQAAMTEATQRRQWRLERKGSHSNWLRLLDE